MRLKLALPILAAAAFAAGAALADPATPAAATAAAPADGPITTANATTPPPPGPGQTPALLTSPPPSTDGFQDWLPNQQNDKRFHGQISAGFDSRGGQYYSGSVEGPIGDNAWLGVSVSQSKWRW